MENNLPGDVVYALNQDNNGYLWVGTGEGIARFDGFSFYDVIYPDSSSVRYPTVSMKDKSGKIWFGCNDGTVFYTQGPNLKQVILPNSSSTGISSILEGPGNKIYIVPQRQPLFSINAEDPSSVTSISFRDDPGMFSAEFSEAGDLLIGTQENLIVCRLKGDSLAPLMRIEGFDYARIMTISKSGEGDEYLIGTDGNGIYRLKLNDNVPEPGRFSGFPGLELFSARSVIKDSKGNLWISTAGDGIYKIVFKTGSGNPESVSHLTSDAGLAGNNVLVLFEDMEENIWMGFNGEGLSKLNSDSFQFFTPGGETRMNDIIFTGKYLSNYMLGTPEGFYTYDISSGKALSFTSVKGYTERKDASAYFTDEDNNIWIGTRGSGLYVRKASGEIKRFYRSGDSGSDYITHIAADKDNIWLATINGVRIISRRTGELRETYNINNGLPPKGINQILLLDDGSAFVAAESDRLYKIVPGSGVEALKAPMHGTVLNKVLGLARDHDGVIWAATYGNGVFECFDDSVRLLSTANGLPSNYAYSIFADSNNDIWVGHESSFSRYVRKTGMVVVYSTDFAKSGQCNPDAFYESSDRKLLIGTTEGLIVYDRSKDKQKQVPPINNINSITINNVEYPYQPSYTLPYKKRYSVRINYTGINLTNPEKVYYSTYLENYDNDWTQTSASREVTYNLREGKYKFNLLSVNDDGLTQETPLSFELTIKPPFWQTWWFMLAFLGTLTGIVVLIIRQREKAQKKIQEYLETELAARTKVVIEQKAELEHQNLEITDSINYARRIQASILPDIKRLKEHFSDAFVMLHPRDIVSGDFYWFDSLDDDRFILVCADSTGHGVPGAFMSMIGTTLLQDIVKRQRISKPSEILSMLDKQIFSILNQNLELGVSNDGMDIVVCEFTMKNRHLRFASAMRPVILVMSGEEFYIKGNRSSVGGQSVMEKYFDDQEYFLNEGDTLYLFSDGLPDQFGGPDGKKMKVARLKSWITDAYSESLGHQYEILEKNYNDWKGDFDQVDDILLMGVRI
jgi:ligand-binding sensor domain-containing protein/serine phosphatase RsbU (regulator of sigma subunit)